MGTIEVLSPLAPANVQERPLTVRLDSLHGKTVGILCNAKPNADVVLERVGSLLRTKFEVAHVVFRRKHSGMAPAYEGLLQELAKCHAVVNGIGD